MQVAAFLLGILRIRCILWKEYECLRIFNKYIYTFFWKKVNFKAYLKKYIFWNMISISNYLVVYTKDSISSSGIPNVKKYIQISE